MCQIDHPGPAGRFAAVLAELAQIVGAGPVLTAPEDLMPYSFDCAAALRQLPRAVVFPDGATRPLPAGRGRWRGCFPAPAAAGKQKKTRSPFWEDRVINLAITYSRGT